MSIAYIHDYGYIEAKEIMKKYIEWKQYEKKLLQRLQLQM